MHILCLHQYYNTPDFPGSGRMHALVKHLSQYGHTFTIISTNTFIKLPTNKKTVVQLAPNVKLICLPIRYHNRLNALGRLPAFLKFVFWSIWVGMNEPKPDLVWGSSTPLTVGWAAMKLASYFKVPFLFEVRDLWPDFPIQMGTVPIKFMQRALYKLEAKLYNVADRVIATSPDMVTHIKSKTMNPENVYLSFMGSDFEDIDQIGEEDVKVLQKQYSLENRKVILYAGSFGRSNDVQSLIYLMKTIPSLKDVTLVLIQGGTGEPYHTPAIHGGSNNKAHVLLLSALSHQETLKWFKLADLSLVTFIDKPVLSSNSPAKLFDSLACGTPVIVTNPGWSKTFVETYKCGWYVPAESPERLLACIKQVLSDSEGLKQAGLYGTRAARHLFDRKFIAKDLQQIITSI